ncbi:MAG: hypothetical protein J6I73_09350 [Treponema sp.]|nr:hypothetical protein [Treponema sp.]
MNKKSIYVYISATLALLVPAPGRFACGILLVLELNVLMFVGTLLRSAVKQLNLVHLGTILLISMLVAFTMLMRQCIALVVPAAALQLGFVMYLPTVSSFLIGYIFGDESLSLHQAMARNMTHVFFYSIFALFFFLMRDILGFGTITFVTSRGIVEKVLFNSSRITLMTFFASIPGALVCTAVILMLYVFIVAKFKIIENAERSDD